MSLYGSGWSKTNVPLSTSTNRYWQIYLSAIDPFKSKYQLLINWRDKVEIKHEKISKALIDHSQTTDEVYENLEHHHSTQKRKMLIVLDYMIANIEANKKSPIVT